MNQLELQHEIAKLLEQVGIIIDEDLKDVEPTLNSKETISYILFVRVAEIFKAISILFSTDVDQVIPATILVRSLSEYYILLKSSVEDETFNSRHIKNAGSEKGKWLEKVLKHHEVSGFKQAPEYFEEMKKETLQLVEEHETHLQKGYQLFEDRKELPMYLNIYVPASMYVHGNRQSFNIYYSSDETVKPTSERDYSSLLRHTGLASNQVMLKAYEFFCKIIKHETTANKRIEILMETLAGKIQNSIPKENSSDQ
jgi:hypothetical protein